MKIKIIEKLLTSGKFTTEELEYILEKIIKEKYAKEKKST